MRETPSAMSTKKPPALNRRMARMTGTAYHGGDCFAGMVSRAAVIAAAIAIGMDPDAATRRASPSGLAEHLASGRFVGRSSSRVTQSRSSRGVNGGSDRRRSGDLPIFSRTLYQLSYRAW